jgi:hypothetical protein
VDNATRRDRAVSAVLLILLVAGGIWIYWRFDVSHHPYRPCSHCGGRRTNAGSRSRSRAWGLCRKCGGRGTQRRYGAPKELLNHALG